MHPTEPTGLLGYQLRLPTFEGPFDVLLRLVERSQLAITDVSLVAVTDQFLAYVEGLGAVPSDTIAEFARVGARLVLLKSRSLLPRPTAPEDKDAADDLAQQLVEYRSVKAAAQQLALRDARGDGAFARGTSAVAVPAATSPPRLAVHEARSLARALKRRLSVIPSPSTVVAAHPLISLRDMIERVLSLLANPDTTRFSRIARRCESPHELRTAFLAVLVLVRRRVIDAEQDVPFGEITLRRSVAAVRLTTELYVGEAADD